MKRNSVIGKLLGLTVVLTLLAALWCDQAMAAEYGTWGDLFWWLLEDSGQLTISGNGEMNEFTGTSWESSRSWWKYQYSNTIKSVIIEEGVTSICNRAFISFNSITSVTLPKSVTSIGDYAFGYCNNLESITLQEGLTSIGKNAFQGSGLKTITLPNSLTSIDDYVFQACRLTNITLPNGLTSIGDHAFDGCGCLTSVTLPESLTSIGEYAFMNCKSLSDLHIGSLKSWLNISFHDVYITSATKVQHGHTLM